MGLQLGFGGLVQGLGFRMHDCLLKLVVPKSPYSIFPQTKQNPMAQKLQPHLRIPTRRISDGGLIRHWLTSSGVVAVGIPQSC